MGKIAPVIYDAAQMGMMYAERLLAGVTRENYARLASPGGEAIQSNHAAFVLGHLCLYPSKVLTTLGRPFGESAVPESYEELFSPGAECRDDAGGTIYPPLEELVHHFQRGHRAALAALHDTEDSVLHAENPNGGRSRELFPTVGAAINFYLTSHVMTHLGQMSAWRRAIGLPAA